MPLHVKLIAEERAAETALRTPALITYNGILSRSRESSGEENAILVQRGEGRSRGNRVRPVTEPHIAVSKQSNARWRRQLQF
jgi:hypothetical protein